MKKFAYHGAVQFLTSQHNGIRVESAAAIAQYLPHLSVGEIAALIRKVNRERRSYSVALPATLVGNTVLLARILPRTYGKHVKPTRLEYQGADRVGNSKLGNVKYVKRAVLYAVKHWGDTLIQDTWSSLTEIHLQNLKGKTPGGPQTRLILSFVTRRDLNKITNDHSGPTSDLIDQDILFVTHLRFEADELCGGRSNYTHYSCLHCGSGFRMGACACGAANIKDSNSPAVWHEPLPQKLEEHVLRLGFRFSIDPSLARAVHRDAWKAAVADEQLSAVRRERSELERKLAEVKQREQAASAAVSAAAGPLAASKEALSSVVKAFDEAVAAGHNARRATRRQKDAQRRLRQKGEATAPAKSGKSKLRTSGVKAAGAGKKGSAYGG